MVEKLGLCYSELVKLKKLWDSANQFQKQLLLSKSNKNMPKSPKETKVTQNSPKERIFDNKTGGIHKK